MKKIFILLTLALVASASAGMADRQFSGLVVGQKTVITDDYHYSVIFTTSDTLYLEQPFVELISGDSTNTVVFPEGEAMLCPDRSYECFDIIRDLSVLCGENGCFETKIKKSS